MLATLEEQRLDAVAYPTLRRKPAIIGEAQIGTTCQLSAATGLPAISMPAGFSLDGLPIGIELLGGAFTEATLLKYAFASEQATRPRRPPFSTPALVHGQAPPPVTFDTVVGGSGVTAPGARVKFTYTRTTGALRYDAAASGVVAPDVVVGLTLQRSEDGQPGPIVAHLLAPNQAAGGGMLMLRGRDRDEFVGGHPVSASLHPSGPARRRPHQAGRALTAAPAAPPGLSRPPRPSVLVKSGPDLTSVIK